LARDFIVRARSWRANGDDGEKGHRRAIRTRGLRVGGKGIGVICAGLMNQNPRRLRRVRVVSGDVSRFCGHGGISFTRAVRVWRAQAIGVRDQGCGLPRTVGRGGQREPRESLPRTGRDHVPSLSLFPFEAGESDGREEGDEGGSCLSASESGGVQLSVMQGCGSSCVASAMRPRPQQLC
jgi:hypothetical protein